MLVVISKDFKCDSTFVNKLSEKMNEIIEKDLPIERVTVSNNEASELYKKFNMSDKLDILTYRPEKDVHLYKCGNYYNYMHSYMVPSTGYLTRYVLKPYAAGIIIQYPRY